MGIDAQLRRETGEIITTIDDHAMVLSRAAGRTLAATRLLKYLVPWGDAVFNQAQAEDLRLDIRDVGFRDREPDYEPCGIANLLPDAFLLQ